MQSIGVYENAEYGCICTLDCVLISGQSACTYNTYVTLQDEMLAFLSVQLNDWSNLFQEEYM